MDNWEYIIKNPTFSEFIHKYLLLNNLRFIRDFKYEFNTKLLYDNIVDSNINKPLLSKTNTKSKYLLCFNCFFKILKF